MPLLPCHCCHAIALTSSLSLHCCQSCIIAAADGYYVAKNCCLIVAAPSYTIIIHHCYCAIASMDDASTPPVAIPASDKNNIGHKGHPVLAFFHQMDLFILTIPQHSAAPWCAITYMAASCHCHHCS